MGGGLIKKRVARLGSGKSAGYRTIIATNKHNKWFFLLGFAKNEKPNINSKELQYLKILSSDILDFTNIEIKKAVKAKEIMEVLI